MIIERERAGEAKQRQYTADTDTHTERQADGHGDGQADGVSEPGQYGGVMGVVVVAHR